jgi:hypothetical protein
LFDALPWWRTALGCGPPNELRWDIYIGNIIRKVPGCSTGKCALCMEVFGANHWLWDVNYLLWGCLEALCTFTLAEAIGKAYVYKGAKYGCGATPTFEWNPYIKRFIEAGYRYCETGKPISATLWATPGYGSYGHNPNYKRCAPCPTAYPATPIGFDWFTGLGPGYRPPVETE